jgi:hypothetical protein
MKPGASQLRDAQADHDAEAQGDRRQSRRKANMAKRPASWRRPARAAAAGQRRCAEATPGGDRARKLCQVDGQAQDAADEREAKFKLDGLDYARNRSRARPASAALQLEIIDIEYKEKERHLQYLLALDKLLGNTEDAAKVAAELAHLPNKRRAPRTRPRRDNQTPFEAYRDSLPKNMADRRSDADDVVAA